MPGRATLTQEELIAEYRRFYSGNRLSASWIISRDEDSAYTNFCDITVRVVKGRVVIIACLDNLIKGASGVAMQNFNLMADFRTMGILSRRR